MSRDHTAHGAGWGNDDRGQGITTWAEIQMIARSNFKVHEDTPDHFVIDLPQAEGRSQLVVVVHLVLPSLGQIVGGDWIALESVFADLGELDMNMILRKIRNNPVGAVGMLMGDSETDVLALRYSMPLARLHVEDFLQPLLLIADLADRLELLLNGRDQF